MVLDDSLWTQFEKALKKTVISIFYPTVSAIVKPGIYRTEAG